VARVAREFAIRHLFAELDEIARMLHHLRLKVETQTS
jgi:hypothetical protein